MVKVYFIKPSPLNSLMVCYHWRIELAFLGSRLQLILYSFTQLCTYVRSLWVFAQFTVLIAYE